jgi:hypothetical protein
MTTPKIDKSLSDIFNVELTKTDKSIEALQLEAKQEGLSSLEKQRQYVLNNLVEMIENGKKLLSNMTTIANSTEQGKDFEIASKLISTIVDTNVTLLDCEVAHAKPQAQESKSGEPSTVTNNTAVFVGTTSDLSNYLKQTTIDAKN